MNCYSSEKPENIWDFKGRPCNIRRELKNDCWWAPNTSRKREERRHGKCRLSHHGIKQERACWVNRDYQESSILSYTVERISNDIRDWLNWFLVLNNSSVCFSFLQHSNYVTWQNCYFITYNSSRVKEKFWEECEFTVPFDIIKCSVIPLLKWTFFVDLMF